MYNSFRYNRRRYNQGICRRRPRAGATARYPVAEVVVRYEDGNPDTEHKSR